MMQNYNYQQYEYDAAERRQKAQQRKRANQNSDTYRNTKRNRKQS